MTDPLVRVSADPWHPLRSLTPARIALGRTGVSLPTSAHLDFQLAHARARDAVHDALDVALLRQELQAAGLQSYAVRSAAGNREVYLKRPDLGRRLDPASLAELEAAGSGHEVVFVVADGLAARAAQHHAVPLLTAVVSRLGDTRLLGPVIVAEQGRVGLADAIGERMGAALVVILLGERPGLSAPDSLGAYLTWAPVVGRTDAERNCVSNIRPAGLGYDAAADTLVHLVAEASRRRLSGIALKADRRMIPG